MHSYEEKNWRNSDVSRNKQIGRDAEDGSNILLAEHAIKAETALIREELFFLYHLREEELREIISDLLLLSSQDRKEIAAHIKARRGEGFSSLD